MGAMKELELGAVCVCLQKPVSPEKGMALTPTPRGPQPPAELTLFYMWLHQLTCYMPACSHDLISWPAVLLKSAPF